jgi:di/tricarboxylate transporter
MWESFTKELRGEITKESEEYKNAALRYKEWEKVTKEFPTMKTTKIFREKLETKPTKYTSLDDIPEDVARQAFEARADKTNGGDETSLAELAVLPGSSLDGRSATDIALRTRFGISLLAVSRQGQRSMTRLRSFAIRPGDVLLMQGPTGALSAFAAESNCVPLADRSLRIPDRRQALLATAVLGGAIGAAAFGLVPAAIAFAAAVLASMALQLVPPRKMYEAIDWPVIVLLGALIPVAGAMETTGAADVIARCLLDTGARGSAVAALVAVLIATGRL